MRIAIFTDTYYPQINGVVTSLERMAQGLADRGHLVYIVAPKYRYHRDPHYPNIKVIRISSVPAFFYDGFKVTAPLDVKLLRFFSKEKIDLIHFLTPVSLGVQAISLAAIKRLPLIGTFHTYIADDEYLKHLKVTIPGLKLIAWKYTLAYYNRADLVTAPSNFTVKELQRRGCKARIAYVSNGIDLKKYNDGTINSKLKINCDGPLIMYVGRIAHEKNINTLLLAFKDVLAKVPKAKLALVGYGPQMDEVKGLVKELGIGRQVKMFGRVEHDALMSSDIWDKVSVFVTTSVTENQPMTVLEAQAKGVPCVGFDKKGMPDLIKSGKNGYLVRGESHDKFAKALIKLISDKKSCKAMAESTKEIVKEHDIEKIVDQWEAIYASEIENKAQTSKTLKLKQLLSKIKP